MANCEKILLAGFTGVGKTSFMRELEFQSPSAEWEFADLDQIIIKIHKAATVEKLIQDHGWEKFRLWERQCLEGWLKEEGKGVLALGGGTLTPLVYELFKPSRRVGFCHLEAPFETCWERLHLPGTEPRPLVQLGKGELHRVYQERQKVFDLITWKVSNPKGEDLAKIAKEFWHKLA